MVGNLKNTTFLVIARACFFLTNSILVWSHQHSEEIVYDLHSTEDGEASEESHGATDHPQLGLQGHLPVLLYLNIGCCVKEDFDKLRVIHN